LALRGSTRLVDADHQRSISQWVGRAQTAEADIEAIIEEVLCL
jgi:hypothetical protein